VTEAPSKVLSGQDVFGAMAECQQSSAMAAEALVRPAKAGEARAFGLHGEPAQGRISLSLHLNCNFHVVRPCDNRSRMLSYGAMNPSKTSFSVAALSAAMFTALVLPPAGQAGPTSLPAANGTATESPKHAKTEEFRELVDDRLKTAMKATDEEWAVIKPLIQKVQAAQKEQKEKKLRGFSVSKGKRKGHSKEVAVLGQLSAPAAPDSLTEHGDSPEFDALKTTLENDSAGTDDIRARVAAVRASRKKLTDDLATSEANLRKVLTVRQEAIMIFMGLLD
jgi:hypothetical protein